MAHKNLPIFHFLFGLVILTFQISCKTPPQTGGSTTPTLPPVNVPAQTSILLLDTSKVLNKNFTGLMIFDIDSNKVLLERNTDKYFVPASNTKIVTYYACVKTLSDSIPAFRYKINGDSLILWGTGDPTFLHPDFNGSKVFSFLKQHSLSKKIFLSEAHFSNPYFGEGWAWDDYNDYYSTEISPFPIYGNIVRVKVKNRRISIQPRFFETAFSPDTVKGTRVIRRNNFNNQFSIPPSVSQSADYQQDIPFRVSNSLTQTLLADTLKKSIGLLNIPVAKDALTLFSISTEGVYRQMMQDSDNMLAEHLLLLSGTQIKDTISSSFAIQSITSRYLQDLPDAPKWVDGSGLSRYNLFTPRSYVKLLLKLYAIVPREKLFSIMAIGGQAGSLRNSYVNNGKPFLFAKTGSFGGVYCLSGYLVTKKGRTMAFSVMNNNFTKTVREVRLEVERILTTIYQQN